MLDHLEVDPARTDIGVETGYFVRAKTPSGRFDSVDISSLTKESLIDWLMSLDKQELIVLITKSMGFEGGN